jgi:hypothetical protein
MACPRVLHRVSAHLTTRSSMHASIDHRGRTSRIGESRIANRASAFSVELQHCSSFIAHRASTLRIVRQPCASCVSLAHRASTSRIARQPRASRGNLAHRAAISRIARQSRASHVGLAQRASASRCSVSPRIAASRVGTALQRRASATTLGAAQHATAPRAARVTHRVLLAAERMVYGASRIAHLAWHVRISGDAQPCVGALHTSVMYGIDHWSRAYTAVYHAS